MTSLASLLIEHPFTDVTALLHTVDQTVTAGVARDRARTLAAALRIEPGRAVGVRLPNGPDLVVAMTAVWLAEGVYVPINPRQPETEVAAIIEELRPACVLTAAGIERRDDAASYDPEIAFVMWTSGTTGAPKPIFHTHAAYLELIDRVLAPLRGGAAGGAAAAPQSPSPNLIPVSMALNAGLYNTLFGLRAGAPLVIMDTFDTATFAELVARFSIRSTVLPPAAIAMLNDSDVGSLAPLKYVRSITAPLSPLQARRFRDRFDVFVLNSYGQAELGEVIGWTAADAKQHPDKVGAAGRPLPGVDIRLDDDAHLWVRPPMTAVGIAERTDADGFVDTGDLARIDRDGFVWIEGRASDLINRGGNKVFPDAVEEVVRLHPAIRDVAVVGIADERLGEVPVAFCVGEPVATSELVGLCREHLTPYKVPVEFRWVDALPRNEIGKVLRRVLIDRGE